MTIKEGYNGKETTIKISAQQNGSIELWIIQNGLEGKAQETLSYMTADELLKLFQEVQLEGKDLFS